MHLSLAVRDLVIATWRVEEDAVARVLPSGVAPVEIDGAHRVSLVALRYEGGRLGPLPVPRFSQLNVRTYVEWEDSPAVFFLATRVSAQGLGGVVFGAPYRYAVLRFRRGSVRAPGLGVSLSYRALGETDPGLLGRQELGLFEHDGLRAVRIERGGADWQAAELTEEPRTDILVAYGFTGLGTPDLVYTPETSFEVEVPPEKISSPRSSARDHEKGRR